jgi:hypothetical protein
MSDDSNKSEIDALLQSSGRSLEVTGLGLILSLILAFWSLVADGALPLSTYLVFVGILLVSVGGLVWRIVKLPATRRAKSEEPRQPGS